MLSLKKNETQMVLTKSGSQAKKVKIELSWLPNSNPKIPDPFDLDATVFFLESGDKMEFDEQHVVFYNNICNVVGGTAASVLKGKTPQQIAQIAGEYIAKGSYCMTLGDERTGLADVDETIILDLERVPAKFKKIPVIIDIHEAKKRNQFMGDVKGSKVVIVDEDNNKIMSYELDSQFSNETGVILGEFTRNGSGFDFTATGKGFTGDLIELSNTFK